METQATSRARTSDSATTLIASFLAWVWVILLAAVAIAKLSPPAPAPAASPLIEFSAERALVHVRAIASSPHPLGSEANVEVRKYLIAQLTSLGLSAETLEATGVAHRGPRIVVARTHDVMARLKGTASTKAIMLVAHYDSVSVAPGAADDSAGVAAILECIRAVRAGPVLKNDLVVLFTDGEEAGLLGAEAFSRTYPALQSVGLILNFEARGNQGPSMLFETSPGNSLLVEAVARYTPHPVGSSLFYALYKLLPNDTDFTVFRPAKIPGLNFAFGENLEAYHSRLDTPENLSLASLQHHGSYAVSLARYFGEMNLAQLKEDRQDSVFFNLLGASMISYRQRWVFPGNLVVTLLLVSILLLNGRRSTLRMRRVGLALLAAIAVIVTVPAVLAGAYWLLFRLLSGHAIIGDSQSNSWLLTGFVLLGACTAAVALVLFRKRFSVFELSLAGLVLVDLLSWIISLTLPAASYLLFWPLLLMTIGLLIVTLADKPAHLGLQAVACLAGTVVTVLLFAPLIYLLYIFLTLQLITVAAAGVLIGLFFVLALPLINIAIPQIHQKFSVSAGLVAALAAFGIGLSLAHHSANHPSRDTAFYSMNPDNHSAVWISFDRAPDNWTAQLFSRGKAESHPMPDYLGGLERPVLSGPASPLDLSPPLAEIKSDQKDGDVRRIRMNVRSQRKASALRLTFLQSVNVVEVKVGDRVIPVTPGSVPLSISLLAMDSDGIDLELTVKASDKISFWLMDQSLGLPDGLRPRPSDIMALNGSDLTLICRKYAI
jgi:hypothetical protein